MKTLEKNFLRHNYPLLQAWFACLSLSLFFFYEFIQINMFNSLASEITQTFSATPPELGFLSASYFYGNIFWLFPAGLILDRFNTKKVVLIAMSTSVLGTFLFCLSHSVIFCALGRFISGAAGGSFCFLSTVRLASRLFPPKKMAFVTGVIVTLGMLGGIVAQTPMVLLVQHYHWQKAVFLLGCLGIFIILLIAILVRDVTHHKREVIDLFSFWQSIGSVMRTFQNWLAGLYTSLLNLPVLVLGALWGHLYLIEGRHLSSAQSSIVTCMIYVGMIFGSPMIGWFSDYLTLRKKPMIMGVLASLLVISIIIYTPELSYFSLIGLFFLLGFFSSAQNIGYPVIAESNHRILTGSALGFGTIIIMSGGAIFQPFFGWLLHVDGLSKAMLILPIGMLVSFLCVLGMKETYCESIIK